MAKMPSDDEVQEMIFEQIRIFNRPIEPNTIAFNVMQMQMALQAKGVTSEAFTKGVNGLIETGYLDYKSGSSFVLITQSGFARL